MKANFVPDGKHAGTKTVIAGYDLKKSIF